MIESYSEMPEAMLAKRQLMLSGDVTGRKQELLTEAILYLNAIGSEPITLFIDSAGGSMGFGLNILNAIQLSAAPVRGVAVAFACSAAFVVLQSCAHRAAYPHATFMFHAPDLGGILLDDERLEEKIKQRMEIHQEFIRALAKRSGQAIKSLRTWSHEEREFLASEAWELGFIDEVIPLPKVETPKKIGRNGHNGRAVSG